MSQESLEACRQAVEAWGRDDFESWLSTIDPTVEWHTVLERLVEGSESFYRGHEGMRDLWHAYRTELEILLRKRVTSSDDGEYRDGTKRGVLRGEGQIGLKRYDRSDRRAVAGEAPTR